MSNFTKLMQQSAAGSAGGAGGLNVEDVFSTYLYTGTSGNITVSNGIDLLNEGGLIWVKKRTSAEDHYLIDTERGVNKNLASNTTAAQSSVTTISSFYDNGFLVRANLSTLNQDYASWTFRKAPKFFTCVTYTGNGVAGLTINHDLGAVPACIMVKRLDTSGDGFQVYHRGVDNLTYPAHYYKSALNTTSAFSRDTMWNDTAPTDTQFQLGNRGSVNTSGGTYVAYLFAHNDGDGDFGPTGDQDIIKCGSYTGTGSSGNFIDLGFEPQFMLIKNTSSSANWIIHDNMRGMIESTGNVLFPNLSAAENTTAFRQARPDATGITFFDGNSETNGSGANYIYIAIRRGPMAVPESATDVFAIDTRGTTGPAFNAGFPIDAALYSIINTTYDKILSSRLTGNQVLDTNNTGAETTFGAMNYDYQEGYHDTTSANSNIYSWMWKRAPNFFDVVAYTGNGVAGRTVSHNLGVAPEMMWVKQRDAVRSWVVYSKDISETEWLYLNSTGGVIDNTANVWNDTRPTDSVFYLSSNQLVNLSGGTYIAYLFASLDGISKVGSYTGNGSTQNIDCGFSSGARFVLIKRTDSTGDWYVWDAERGIVSANDPHLSLNTTAAQVTTDDSVDPVSSGFAVNQVAATNINVSSATYIYYAVA